ncbi:MAG: M20/M25/M40 family metallo-hydrolase [Acidimicrobiales bacterium]
MTTDALDYAEAVWDRDILPALTEYIRVPALSPAYDADWAAHGHIAEAVRQVRAWAEARPLPGLAVEVVELAGLTPVILIDAPARGPAAGADDRADNHADGDVVLVYGHLDKQPEMSGWRDGLGPWSPVREGDRLYGRGGADDGYSAFAALTALEALAAQDAPHARVVILIEASEESGSPHLPAYIDALAARIGRPSLVVCLDSGCADYEQLWVTTSLRGLVGGVLDVAIATEGMHSGGVGGVVPSTFRIARRLLERIERSETGEILLPEAHVEIPPHRRAEAEEMAAAVGGLTEGYPLVPGARLADKGPAELILDRTWRPALAVIAADGLPAIGAGGNVLRPRTALALSLRVPPTADPAVVGAALERALVESPPYGAAVAFHGAEGAPGWNAPATAAWLSAAAASASAARFGRPAGYMGEGGTIPFMGMLGQRFPDAQFLIVGVLGPGSNAHGPNEFLHVPYAKRLTACIADVLAAHARR